MNAALDTDEKNAAQATRFSGQRERPLDDLADKALRMAFSAPVAPVDAQADAAEPLEADDAFFGALEEIRTFGRALVAHRRVELLH